MKIFKVMMSCLVLVIGSACAHMGVVFEGEESPVRGRVEVSTAPDRGGSGSYFKKHGYERLGIPKGQYPPPGQCRIWYPGIPPGQQPPPGDCGRLSSQVPPGAWLIQHPGDDKDHVHISVYDKQRPGTIIVIGEFEIDTGVFVREIKR